MQDLITEAEAAKIFNVTKHTLAKWRKEKGVAHYNLGGRIMYAESDLEDFLTKSRVKPKPARKP